MSICISLQISIHAALVYTTATVSIPARHLPRLQAGRRKTLDVHQVYFARSSEVETEPNLGKLFEHVLNVNLTTDGATGSKDYGKDISTITVAGSNKIRKEGNTDINHWATSFKDDDNTEIDFYQTFYTEASALENISPPWVGGVGGAVLLGLCGVIFWWTSKENPAAGGDAPTSPPSGDSSEILADGVNILCHPIGYLFLLGNIVFMMHMTILIPDSYNFSLDLGHGATFSGMIIGIVFVPMWLSAVVASKLTKPWSQPFARRIAVGGWAAYVLLALVEAFAASPESLSSNLSLNNSFRSSMFISARLGIGITSGFWLIERMMVQKILPHADNVFFGMLDSTSKALGIGLGPIASSLVNFAVGATTARARTAMPFLFLVLLSGVLALVKWVQIPSDIDVLMHHKAVTESTLPTGDQDSANLGTADRKSVFSYGNDSQIRLTVWVKVTFLCMERALIVSTVEVASSFLLQVDYSLPTSQIGLIIGTTLILGIVCLVPVCFVQRREYLSDGALMCLLSAVVFVASFLFFSQVGDSVGTNGTRAFWPILVADALIYTPAYIVNGLAEGLQLEFALAGSWFSQENTMVFNCVFQDMVGRFIGPCLGRYIIASRGQNAYAGLQLTLTALSFATALSAWSSVDAGRAALRRSS